MAAIINTRADLEVLRAESPECYAVVMANLKASMTMLVDKAAYPDGYGASDYSGPKIEADWQSIETLQSIERLDFTKDEFLMACTEIGL